MAIPITYNLRNLVVRKTTTLMTAAGIALTVAVLVADLALVNGLNTAFQTTGIGSMVTFSEFAFNFRVSPTTMLIGIAFALVVGAIGGLFPARNASRKEILTALREI
jgi:ABC-type lipoprotein release transport system permease subunit